MGAHRKRTSLLPRLRPGALPALILIAIVFGSSCTSRYARNRARDAADIITLEVQTGSYGLSARVGPLKAGLNYKSPRGFAGGLRGGHFGRFYSAEFTALLFGADYFGGQPMKDLDPPEKPAPVDEESPDENEADAGDADPAAGDRLAPAIPGLTEGETQGSGATESDGGPGEAGTLAEETEQFTVEILKQRGKEFRSRSPFGTEHSAAATRSLIKDKRTKFSPLYYFTQVEVTVGLWGGLKVGINFGELLDFLLGFVGIDIMNDDEPYQSPELERLRKSPVWDRLDPKTREDLLRQMGER